MEVKKKKKIKKMLPGVKNFGVFFFQGVLSNNVEENANPI